MNSYLLCSPPIYGHLVPALAIGRGLVERGHRVTVLSGRKYRSRIEENGMTFLPLPESVDYDDADLDSWLPGRDRYKGLAAVRHDLIGMFVRPIPEQHRALSAALDTAFYDAVACEAAFLGAIPTMQKPKGERVPVLGFSSIPMTLTSVDAAPFGPALAPGDSAVSRLRNRLLNTVLHRGPLRPVQVATDAALAEVGAHPTVGNFFDAPTNFDEVFQLSARSLEYPRRELPDTVRFVGPLREASGSVALPEWWADLSRGRPVVHVTQGTIDNRDLSRLVAPTIRALAGEDVLVVATTGGRPVAELLQHFPEGLPANARVGEFLPYDELLPRTAVVVTNGGFGGVQQALAHGIPLVVAGATEDKPEVAARVAWSGTGVNLRTGSPTPDKVRAGVRRALTEPSYRAAADRLRAEIASYGDPVDAVAAALERVVAGRGCSTAA